MKQFVNAEDWGHSVYTAYLDLNGDFRDLKKSATGVVSICFNENDEVILMNNEPIGGHVEPDETVEEALKREALEEGGMKLLKWKYFGYYEIQLKDDAPLQYKEKYPKVGHILFFLAKGKKVMEPCGRDVKSTQVLSKERILTSKEIKHKMLLEGLKLYPGYLKTV